MSVSLGPVKISWNESSAKPTSDTKVLASGVAIGVVGTLATTYLAPKATPYVVAGASKVYSASASGCQTVVDSVKRVFGGGDTVVVDQPKDNKGAATPAAVRTWGDTAISVFTLGFK